MGLFSKTPKLLIFAGRWDGAEYKLADVIDDEVKKTMIKILSLASKGKYNYSDVSLKLVKVVNPDEWHPEPFDDWSISEAENDADNPFTKYIEKKYGTKLADSVQGVSRISVFKNDKDGYVLFYLPLI